LEHRKQKEAGYLAMLNECRGLIVSLCSVHSVHLDCGFEDIIQDINASLWQSFDSFRGESSRSTWAYRVALNTIYLHYRKQNHSPNTVHLTAEHLNTIPDRQDSELINQLYQLIELLPTDDRSLITMYLEHIPQKEIGVVLGVSEDVVNYRINKIKKKLKSLNDNENRKIRH